MSSHWQATYYAPPPAPSFSAQRLPPTMKKMSAEYPSFINYIGYTFFLINTLDRNKGKLYSVDFYIQRMAADPLK